MTLWRWKSLSSTLAKLCFVPLLAASAASAQPVTWPGDLYDDFEDGVIDPGLWATGGFGDCAGVTEVYEADGMVTLHATCTTTDKNNQATLFAQTNFFDFAADRIYLEASLSMNQGYNRDHLFVYFTRNPIPHYRNTIPTDDVLLKEFSNDGFTDAAIEISLDKVARTALLVSNGDSTVADLSSLGDDWYLVFAAHGRQGYGYQGGMPPGNVTLSLNWMSTEGTGLTVSLPDTVSGYAQSISIPARITDVTGLGVVSAELFVAYDADVVTVFSSGASAATTSARTSGWTLQAHVIEGVDTSIDTLKVAMATDNDTLSGAGDLVNLHFQVADLRHPAATALELVHLLLNDGTPAALAVDGSITLTGTDGAITSTPESLIPRWAVTVQVDDVDEDRTAGAPDSFQVGVTNGLQLESLWVVETGPGTGSFVGSISTIFSLAATSGDGIVQAQAGDIIHSCYTDSLNATGTTVDRCDTSAVIGGVDGTLAVTRVVQPGDSIRVRLTDDDLNTDSLIVETTRLPGLNLYPAEPETLDLLETDVNSGVFFGLIPTAPSPGVPGDGVFAIHRWGRWPDSTDIVQFTYDDTLTLLGGTARSQDTTWTVARFGDANFDDRVGAYDAHLVLKHRLARITAGMDTLGGLDSLSANVDSLAPDSTLTAYDAALILMYRVGVIPRFPVQMPWSLNHPQPETAQGAPKILPPKMLVELRPGDGVLTLWAQDRSQIVSAEVLLAGVAGKVELPPEMAGFLIATQAVDEHLAIVLAGARPADGPGELLHIRTEGTADQARLVRAQFNGGHIQARGLQPQAVSARPLLFALHPNVPNPFNPTTTIAFDLPHPAHVTLDIYDVLGQKVRTLVTESLAAGTHAAQWDGRNSQGILASSGMYLVRLRAADGEQSRQQTRVIMLLK